MAIAVNGNETLTLNQNGYAVTVDNRSHNTAHMEHALKDLGFEETPQRLKELVEELYGATKGLEPVEIQVPGTHGTHRSLNRSKKGQYDLIVYKGSEHRWNESGSRKLTYHPGNHGQALVTVIKFELIERANSEGPFESDEQMRDAVEHWVQVVREALKTAQRLGAASSSEEADEDEDAAQESEDQEEESEA